MRSVGSKESERFLSCFLYQGVPRVDAQYVLSKGGSETKTADMLHAEPKADPTIFCTRFDFNCYCFRSVNPQFRNHYYYEHLLQLQEKTVLLLLESGARRVDGPQGCPE